ncbi:hypothetical protein [Catenibacterium sp.]|uniref:hypothetical protein n=1 Tax=Catenibacterium sp. TaxID=2049022 RepID=UPI002E77FA4C|nr:hypothetical protein [Catenibacterium sp.]MEE0042894.1 hypothetical protein [Catenibacterium sp.]
MKGTNNEVSLSLLGLEKMVKADLGEALVENTEFVVKFPESVELTTRQMSRELTAEEQLLQRTHQLGIELTSDGRVPNGEAPILVGVGFTKDSGGNVVFGSGNHVMIAGNFVTVFAGKTCKECAEAYDKAVSAGKKIVMKAAKSAKGKFWSEFAIKK